MSALDGQFVWFDLMTPDLEASKAFYERLVGWRTTRSPAGDYEMWKACDVEVGGRVALAAEGRESGVAPYWLGYLTVASVDQTVERVPSVGGRVLIPGTNIPNGGRFAVLADPQGAIFAIHRPSTPQAPPDPAKPGHFGWAELNSTDWSDGWRFYRALFGWESGGKVPVGPPLGEYALFGIRPERPMGGMSNAAVLMGGPSHWLYYVTVADLAEALKTVQETGGRVLNGPIPVPGGGQIAQCQDPQGGLFALSQPGG